MISVSFFDLFNFTLNCNVSSIFCSVFVINFVILSSFMSLYTVGLLVVIVKLLSTSSNFSILLRIPNSILRLFFRISFSSCPNIKSFVYFADAFLSGKSISISLLVAFIVVDCIDVLVLSLFSLGALSRIDFVY